VTICYNEKFNSKAFNVTDVLYRYTKNLEISQAEEVQLHALCDICPQMKKSFELRSPSFNMSSSDFYLYMTKIMPFSSGAFEFNGIIYKNSRDALQTTITFNQGPCKTFNLANSSDMFTENISKTFRHDDSEPRKRSPHGNYPHHLDYAGSKYGFRLEINISKQTYMQFCTPKEGFVKVALHSPYDLPDVSFHFAMVPFETHSRIFIKPQVIGTDDHLSSFPTNVRQCIFNYERKLSFFKVYSRSNCEIECQTEHYIKNCGCVKFFMVHNESTRICQSASEIKCFKNAIKVLREAKTACNCLAACNDIQYDFATTNMPYSESDVFFSFMEIYYASDRFLKLQRTEAFGLVDFLSSCGGFLGLMLGGSVMSLIQIIYHIFLKKFFEKKKAKKELEKILKVVGPVKF
jgi:acid-sensing ion channel, other